MIWNWWQQWIQWWYTSPPRPDNNFVLVRRPAGKKTQAPPPPCKARKQHIAKPLRDQVWTYYVGSLFQTLCPCCSHVTIDALHFECGHVQSEATGGATQLHNLRPICKPCNASMGKTHLHAFMARCGFPPHAMDTMDALARRLPRPASPSSTT